MEQYEVLDISGDAGIRAFGRSPEELFVNAALGMYSLIVDPETVLPKERIEIPLRHESFEGLLVAWLNELIFRFDARGFLGREIAIEELSAPNEAAFGGADYVLQAFVAGEPWDADRHRGNLLLKAATYHNLKVEQQNGLWTAEIIFDI